MTTLITYSLNSKRQSSYLCDPNYATCTIFALHFQRTVPHHTSHPQRTQILQPQTSKTAPTTSCLRHLHESKRLKETRKNRHSHALIKHKRCACIHKRELTFEQINPLYGIKNDKNKKEKRNEHSHTHKSCAMHKMESHQGVSTVKQRQNEKRSGKLCCKVKEARRPP